MVVSSHCFSAVMQNLQGKTALITGGNTGIGYETGLQLAKQNATVVLACRDDTRCQDAVSRIQQVVPAARLSAMHLDLASLASVRQFSKEFHEHHTALVR